MVIRRGIFNVIFAFGIQLVAKAGIFHNSFRKKEELKKIWNSGKGKCWNVEKENGKKYKKLTFGPENVKIWKMQKLP